MHHRIFLFFIFDHDLRFKEEILLSNGELIQVSRVFKTESFGEIGGLGGWEAKFNSMVIIKPMHIDNPPIWKSDAGLIPIVFDRDSQTKEWFLVTTFYSCEVWYRLGKPKLPYAEFRLKNGIWVQVELSARLIGRKANVMTGVRSGGEPELLTLKAKRTRNFAPAIAGSFLEIVSHWTTGC